MIVMLWERANPECKLEWGWIFIHWALLNFCAEFHPSWWKYYCKYDKNTLKYWYSLPSRFKLTDEYKSCNVSSKSVFIKIIPTRSLKKHKLPRQCCRDSLFVWLTAEKWYKGSCAGKEKSSTLQNIDHYARQTFAKSSLYCISIC